MTRESVSRAELIWSPRSGPHGAWFRWIRATIVLVLISALMAPVAVAQEEPPPELGDVVVTDGMTAPGLVSPQNCATNANPAQFSEEGLRLTLNGACLATPGTGGGAFKSVLFPTLHVPDGEVRFDLKVTDGFDRLGFSIFAHGTPGAPAATTRRVQVSLNRGLDRASIIFLGGGKSLSRGGLAALMPPDTWISVAVRMKGNVTWLLIDDQPFLSFADADGDGGSGTGLSILFLRTAPGGDAQDITLALRNLKVSALAGGDVARVPSVGAPQTSPSTAAAPGAAPSKPVAPLQPPTGDPWVGDIKFGYDPNGGGATGDGGSLTYGQEGMIYGFFSWRNVPVGSTFNCEYIMGYDRGRHFDEPANRVAGTLRIGLLRSGPPDPGAVLVIHQLTLIISLNGNEMARGTVFLK